MVYRYFPGGRWLSDTRLEDAISRNDPFLVSISHASDLMGITFAFIGYTVHVRYRNLHVVFKRVANPKQLCCLYNNPLMWLFLIAVAARK